MRRRCLLDEHISPRVATSARRAGLDVLAVSGSDLAGLDDESLLRECVRQGRILVTYNIGDFAAIYRQFLSEGLDLPGIVFVDSRTIPTDQVGKLSRALLGLAKRMESGEVSSAGGLFLTR